MQHLQHLASTAANLVGEVPPQRWLLDAAPPEQATARHASWAYAAHHLASVRYIELFDGLSFGVSRAEAAEMDPQQRLLLETTHVAIHSAGCFAATALEGSGTAVFLGISNADFRSFLAASDSVYAGEWRRAPQPSPSSFPALTHRALPHRSTSAVHSYGSCHLGRRRENLLHIGAAGSMREHRHGVLVIVGGLAHGPRVHA